MQWRAEISDRAKFRKVAARVMTLEIVWRNPIPTETPKTSILRIVRKDRLDVYVVSNAETTGEFEVFVGGAA